MKQNKYEIGETEVICRQYYQNVAAGCPDGKLKEFHHYFYQNLDSWVNFKESIKKDALS